VDGGATVTSTSQSRVPDDIVLRARGVLLGAAVGDALGWPQEQRSGIVGGARARNTPPRAEFREWPRMSGSQFAKYREVVRAGEYSDDTQLLLAVARSCQRGVGWTEYLTGVELPAWSVYQRGGGRAVLSAARSWLAGGAPWVPGRGSKARHEKTLSYFNAGANGVAMRIAPHVLVTLADDDVSELVARVIADGIATHGHMRALLGGVMHAQVLRAMLLRSGTLAYGDLIEQLLDEAAWCAPPLEGVVPADWLSSFREVTGESPEACWDRTVDELKALLQVARNGLQRGAMADDDAVLNELGCFDSKINGSGTVTAAAAAYLVARSAARPLSGLLRSSFLRNADTDTLASMVASALGALHGTAWLNELGNAVQDSDYVASFAMLVSGSEGVSSWQQPLFDSTLKQVDRTKDRDVDRLYRELGSQSEGELGRFLDGRQYVIEFKEQLETRTSGEAFRWRLRLDDSQTIVIDRLVRHTRASSPSGSYQPQKDDAVSSRGSAPRATVISVTLQVADLPTMAGFYRNILGLPVRGAGTGVVDVGPMLRLQAGGAHVRGNAVLEIGVPDLKSVCDRLGLEPRSAQNGSASVVDPEGNTVILRPA
jgi:ADP-ribosylglycohydrolase